jgi:aryl-alcohol dehydrogenase-like predicted oxidoreductase
MTALLYIEVVMTLKYNRLGRTSLNVSRIGLGCSGFWGNKQFSETKAHRIVYQAHELGINLFDTGHNYSGCNAEPRLGKALWELMKTSGRDSFIVSSKAGTVVARSRIVRKNSANTTNFTPDYIEQTCLKSIQNLRCDYLDIFQLHGIPAFAITDELIVRLQNMKQSGMCRYIGINTHDPITMAFLNENPEIFDIVLLDYNAVQLDREPVIEQLNRNGLGVVAGTALAQGHLIDGKIGSMRSMADIWYLLRANLKKEGRILQAKSKTMRQYFAQCDGFTPAQLSLAFVLENKHISSVIFGTKRLSHVNELFDALDKKIPADILADIIKFNQNENRQSAHRHL